MLTSPFRLDAFAEEVQSKYAAATPESFWGCESAVRQLLKSGAISSWFNQQLGTLTKDPQSVGDWGAKEVILHRGAGWTVSVALFDSTRRYIHALPFIAFYAPLGASALVAHRFKLPERYRNEVFDPTIRLEPLGSVSIPCGDLLPLKTEHVVYDFHITAPTPVLRVATTPVRPLEWLFSKSTLQAWQANDATVAYTQLRVAAFVLGKIAHHSSIAPLRRLAEHPHHAVRWAAIQNLGRLSRSEALAKIREAINDPHPHVRRAAQKTLEQLDRRIQR